MKAPLHFPWAVVVAGMLTSGCSVAPAVEPGVQVLEFDITGMT